MINFKLRGIILSIFYICSFPFDAFSTANVPNNFGYLSRPLNYSLEVLNNKLSIKCLCNKITLTQKATSYDLLLLLQMKLGKWHNWWTICHPDSIFSQLRNGINVLRTIWWIWSKLSDGWHGEFGWWTGPKQNSRTSEKFEKFFCTSLIRIARRLKR